MLSAGARLRPPKPREDAMTAAALAPVSAGAGHPALKILGYGAAIVLYTLIFFLAIAHLALIEIRQANMKAFDSLIAILEQKENYLGDVDSKAQGYLQGEFIYIQDKISQYDQLDPRPFCTDGGATLPNKEADSSAAPPAAWGDMKTDAASRTFANQQLCELRSLLASVAFKEAALPRWYDKYIDGLRADAPQLIPLLRIVESRVKPLMLWTRLPLVLLEMLLLVWMGALGGVIAATRCFVDGAANPKARDLAFRPAAGAVVALGIYVLYRAVQLFFGGGSGRENAAAVSTSVFLLAGLGLAAGFAAREAVDVIQATARRMLERVKPADPAE
jgi:hypothetical protein